MNHLEQILIRMGVDARSVVVGLNSIKSYVKGWGTSLVEEMRGVFFRLFAAGVAIEGFAKVKEEMLEINRLSEELNVSTNFIQSLQLKSMQMGVAIEALTRPLVVFNRQIGDAKRGLPDAIEKIQDMGIISNRNQLATLSYAQAMQNLKIQFDKIGDSAKQDALLNEAFGNSAYRVAFIFRQTQAEFASMQNSSFFTKFRPETLGDFQGAWNALKVVGYSIGATLTNTFESVALSAKNTFSYLIEIGKHPFRWPDLNKVMRENYQQSLRNAELAKQNSNNSEQDIEVEQQKAEILSNQTQLLQRQLELKSEIADRDKSSISEMASRTRRLLGIPEPRNYTISDRDRQALRIDTLEKQAQIAFERGNDKQFQSLRSEADQLRAALPWARLQDRDPMQRTNSELVDVNTKLEPVQAMAKLVISQHTNP